MGRLCGKRVPHPAALLGGTIWYARSFRTDKRAGAKLAALERIDAEGSEAGLALIELDVES
jgi:hypothetical protein